MKILHLSAHNGEYGAGLAAARIHCGLLARGIESKFCAAYPTVPLVNSFTPAKPIWKRLADKFLCRIDEWLVRNLAPDPDEPTSTGFFGHNIHRIVKSERPDVVHLHWIGQNAFRLSSLKGIQLPLVWRLPDMWSFCSLKNYQSDAKKYIEAPATNQNPLELCMDISRWAWKNKCKTYQQIESLTIACPSRWLAGEVNRSYLLGNRPIEIVPTGCDSELFKPRDKASCRRALDLPLESAIILIGADSLRSARKGTDLFLNALAKIEAQPGNESIRVVTFGSDPFTARGISSAVSIEHFGKIRSRRLMPVLYNAADVFVAPSRMENLANTVLESLSCGTPVAAFDIGGMPEMIDHMVNGFLAPPFDTSSFAEGIRWALGRRGDEQVRRAARAKVLREFSLDQEIDYYIDLYGRLLALAN